MSKNNWTTRTLSPIQVISCIVLASVLLFVTNVAVLRGHSTPANKAAAATTIGGAGVTLAGIIIASNPVTIIGAAILVVGAGIWTAAEFDDGESEASVAPRELSRDSYRQTCGVSRAVSRLTLAVA